MAGDLIIRPKSRSDIKTLQESVSHETLRQIGRMENITTAATEAMDLQSEISEYAMVKAMTTLRTAALMQTMAATSRVAPEVQAAQRHFAMEYLYTISRTTQLANDRIIETLSDMSARDESESFLDRVRNFFS